MDYNFVRWGRGGVGIYGKSKFKDNIIIDEFRISEVLENILVNGRQQIIVFVVKRPPSRSLNQCIMVLDEAITLFLSKFSNFVMLGDLNINLMSHPNLLSACLEAHGLSQLVATPTTITQQIFESN